jgi:Kinase associated domain 1
MPIVNDIKMLWPFPLKLSISNVFFCSLPNEFTYYVELLYIFELMSKLLCYQVTLSDMWSQACVTDIFQMIREQMVARGSVVGETADRSGLALHAPGGVQVELTVSGEADARGLRVRRISGDQLQYKKLCHELFACIRV